MPQAYYNRESYRSRRSLGYLLRRGAKLLTARMEAMVGERDLNFAHWAVLMNLRDSPPMTCVELRQRMIYDSGAFTRLIDQLEERGLVRRHRLDSDRRAVEIQITDKGRALAEEYLPRIIGLQNKLLQGFSKEEADRLVDLLLTLNARLDETEGGN
jgi:DNA-binding MarR family transcriptional regulator